MFRIQGGPPLSQNGTADFSRALQDGGMVHGGLEFEHGCLEGVLRGEFQPQHEFSSGVGGVVGSLEGHIPDKQVVLDEFYTENVLDLGFFEFGAFLWWSAVEVVCVCVCV